MILSIEAMQRLWLFCPLSSITDLRSCWPGNAPYACGSVEDIWKMKLMCYMHYWQVVPRRKYPVLKNVSPWALGEILTQVNLMPGKFSILSSRVYKTSVASSTPYRKRFLTILLYMHISRKIDRSVHCTCNTSTDKTSAYQVTYHWRQVQTTI